MSQKRSRAAFESHDATNPPSHAPYVLYGTPLPAYDPEARDDGSYVPVWQQEVTDERGRKRLHGAFTGGWSAGYFNTVGSKEGWTPSTFVSSRSNRARGAKDGGGQKVEDFMDDEDLAQLAESQTIETQGEFAGLGKAVQGSNSAGGMFADLFKTTGETMGVKLLQRMGWRQGQGIGSKIMRRVKGDQKGEMHLFAPDDSRMITFNRKTDRKGLGFAGEASLDSAPKERDTGSEEDDERDARILNRSKVLKQSKKIKKKNSSFGVGVLNDTGSDEEDAYDIGPKISYHRILGGDKKKKQAGLGSNAASGIVQKPVFTSKKLAQRTSALSGFRKCYDGRLPIDGFVLSLAPLSLVQENKYPPPTPPEGWKPSQILQNTSEKENIPYQSTGDAAKASQLDPKSRAALLGEQLLPGKSVFDFMTPAAREHLASATGKTNLPPALGESAPSGFAANKTSWDLVPDLDPAAASAALQRCRGGWTPYSEDEGKKARYLSFLELKAGLQTALPSRPPASSTEDWANEMREFAQAAHVFKPISGLMASRFTSSSAAPRLASDAPDPTPGSNSSNTKPDDPAENAAKMGMFGPMTRSRVSFFPTRLLCKRFNVRPPASVAAEPGGGDRDGEGSKLVDESRRLDVVSQASLDMMMMHAGSQPRAQESGRASTYVHPTRREMVEIDAEKNDALEAPRAAEEVFKAVFGDAED